MKRLNPAHLVARRRHIFIYSVLHNDMVHVPVLDITHPCWPCIFFPCHYSPRWHLWSASLAFLGCLTILALPPALLAPALYFVSSVRSSSGYQGLIRTYPAQQQPTFSNFSNSSDSKVKVKVKGPSMCYIFEKHGIQGYRI